MKKIIPVTLKEPDRICGGCTLCCKVLAIHAINKMANQWCRHASKHHGCRIYTTRPAPCQSFSCLWLQGLTEIEHRPDKIHGVLSTSTNGETIAIFEDPGFPGIARLALRAIIDRLIADGKRYVIVACGDRRTLIGRPDLVERTVIDKINDNQWTFTTHDERPSI